MKNAFTLIELLMVIALIAIVSTLAVTKIGGIKEASARRVSLANQKAVERGVEAYLSFENHRGIDRLDSLMDDEVAENASYGFFDVSGSFTNNTASFYMGPDTLNGLDAATVAEQNSGLTPYLINAVFTPYSLNTNEVYALGNWGYHYVMRHATRANEVLRDAYGPTADDGAYLPTGDASLEYALDPNRSACIPRSFKEGMVVAAVSPFTPAGRAIYRDCGQLLLDTELTPAAYLANSTSVIADVKSKGGALIALGLGDNATVIGTSDAGLESAPYATYPNRKYYTRYILLFRIDTSTRAGTVTFAGVLDPCGNTVRTAQQAL